MKLTPRARAVLAAMLAHRDDEEGELTRDGAQWWLGLDRTSASVANQLLRACLIRLEVGDLGDRYQVWVATEEARPALEDPAYVPLIERAVAGRARRDGG